MIFEIKNRFDESVVWSGEAVSMKEAAESAVVEGANLRGAVLEGLNLQGADLRGADLRCANLRGAVLQDADLRGANLQDAYLQGANLGDADLRGAYLRCVKLWGANLRGADLEGVNLQDADLRGAYLQDADLRGAYLRGANLEGANLWSAELEGATLPSFQLDQGVALIGWKKLRDNRICKLEIPAEAARTAALCGPKKRAEYARIISIESMDGSESFEEGFSMYDKAFRYEVGMEIRPSGPEYKPDIRVECAAGIHFFLTRKEAEDWQRS